MALPAFVLPERWFPRLPEVAEHQLAVWRQARASLVQRARETRPPDRSEPEQRVLHDFLRLAVGITPELAPELLDALRDALELGLKELLAKEREAADTKWQLAIRHLEQAVDTFGVVAESWATALRSLPQATWQLLAEQLTHAVAGACLPPMSEDERALLRFELDLVVAIECLDGPLDDLTYWARRAVMGARKVQAMPSPKLPAGWRGELARLRAKLSWSHWDEDEVRKELEPWADDLR